MGDGHLWSVNIKKIMKFIEITNQNIYYDSSLLMNHFSFKINLRMTHFKDLRYS